MKPKEFLKKAQFSWVVLVYLNCRGVVPDLVNDLQIVDRLKPGDPSALAG